jgi:hypothetical protein
VRRHDVDEDQLWPGGLLWGCQSRFPARPTPPHAVAAARIA